MKHASPGSQRFKLIFMIVASLLVGAGLIALSTWVGPEGREPAAAKSTGTAPASAPAPMSPREASAQNVSGMLLLFGLAGLLVAAVFVILLVVDIRKSRPAWQTQHRFPKRR